MTVQLQGTPQTHNKIADKISRHGRDGRGKNIDPTYLPILTNTSNSGLRRVTRNHISSEAQVQILLTSILFFASWNLDLDKGYPSGNFGLLFGAKGTVLDPGVLFGPC